MYCQPKSTADRPHFILAYGTRKAAGLKAFREVEYAALRGHHKLRAKAKQHKRENKTRHNELFTSEELGETSFEAIAEENCRAATLWIRDFLAKRGRSIQFGVLVLDVLERFVVRETNVKDICVELARTEQIENTWKAQGRHKPIDSSTIMLRSESN